MTRRAPFEAHLKVAKPCPAKWDDMVGDDKSRHCDRCQKNVYNLELLEPEELVELIERTEGKFCGRLYRRPGELTVLTQDCKVGMRIARRKVVGRAALAVAALGGAAVGASQIADAVSPPVMVMGEIEPMRVLPTEVPEPEPIVLGKMEVAPEELAPPEEEEPEDFLMGDVVIEPVETEDAPE